ncbi:hypothetical protein PQR64_21705 [Paraburkholderia phytofirmans]|uniref:Uncharacterized protein n=1 Tax=Paraburkholderia dipogonis TaxID=1211383 RepID=A0A4Y8N947_9BURK|nr:hypothetical protein E2553_14525 [Paraburkholderia dipogonis]
MTVPSNLSSTRFSSLAPTSPAERPAAANNPGAATPTRESGAQTPPSLPTGLVGHHVNTTA